MSWKTHIISDFTITAIFFYYKKRLSWDIKYAHFISFQNW